jgi:hypothetical protein
LLIQRAANEGDEVMADNGSFQPDIVADLMAELNLDDAEKTTITNLVAGATGVVTSSVGVLDETDPIAKLAIKTMVTQQYYDRALENGLSHGVLMMLLHLQANQPTNSDSGDTDGN